MKFISSLAAIAAYAGAVSLSAETDVAAQVSAELTTESTTAVEVEATTEVTAEATTEVEAEATTETATESKVEVLAQTTGPEHGFEGPIVPESYEYAVHDFDLNQPFTD